MKGTIEIVGEIGVIKIPSEMEISRDSQGRASIEFKLGKAEKIGEVCLFEIELVGQGDD